MAAVRIRGWVRTRGRGFSLTPAPGKMAAMRARLIIPLCSVVLVACFTGHPDLPPPKVPTHPTVEEWPDAGAVITDETATLTYELMDVGESQRFAGVLVHRLQIKILSEAGLAQARFELPMDGFSSISRVVARSVDRFGGVTYMEPDEPRAVRRGKPGHDAPELKYLVFKVPDASVGGVIDVLYTRVYTEAMLVPSWSFGGPLPKLRSEYSIAFGPEVRIDIRFGRGASIVDVQPLRRELPEGYTRLVFVEKDIPAYYGEPWAPHPTWTTAWVASVIVDGKIGKDTQRLRTWTDVAERVREAIERVGTTEVRGSPEERYAKVRDSLSGLDDIGLGVRAGTWASNLMSGSPACTRDAGALLYNVLEDTDAKVFPALITGPKGPAVSEGFPSLYGFIRLVVAVDVRDEVARDPTCTEDPVSRGLLCSVPTDSYAFLDPLCAGCRYGELPTEYTGGRALVLLPEEGPKWIDIPEDPPERNRTLVQFKLALDVDGSLVGNMNGELTGAPARRLRRGLTRNGDKITDTQRNAVVSEVLLGPKAGLALSATRIIGLDNRDEPLTVEAQVTAKAEKLGFEKFRINPRQVFGAAMPGRWRSSRRTTAILDTPAWYEAVASIQLPVGYDVLEDPVAKLVTPFAEYASGFALRGRTLNFSRRLVIRKHFVPADEWREVSELLAKVRDVEENGIPVFLAEGVEESD